MAHPKDLSITVSDLYGFETGPDVAVDSISRSQLPGVAPDVGLKEAAAERER